MKKVLAIAFIGSLFAVSCSKKEDKSLQDSNIMLEEPVAPAVTDSSTTKPAIPAPSPSTTPAPADSAAVK